jgi:tetratricopeptide (TPR) repeat protein
MVWPLTTIAHDSVALIPHQAWVSGRTAASFLGLCSLAALGLAQPQSAGGADKASQTCPASFESLPAELPRAHLLRLIAMAEQCETDAAYFAYLGGQYLSAGRVAEAATQLEKALLLNPDLPGAQLDYAQALAQMGQKSAAIELVDQVSARPDIRPELKFWLQGLSQAKPVRQWEWAALLQTSIGRESNLNNATYTDQLTLSLPTGPIDVPLGDEDAPRKGMSSKTAAVLQGRHALGAGQIGLALLLQSRNPRPNSFASTEQADIALDYGWPAWSGKFNLRVNRQFYRKSDQYRYNEQAASFKYLRALPIASQCDAGASLGYANQVENNTTLQRWRQHNYRLELQCQIIPGGTTGLQVAKGFTRPSGEPTPGGNKKRNDLSFRHEQAVPFAGRQGQLSIWSRQTLTVDSEATLPLLGSIVVGVQRFDAGLGYWWPLGKQWSLGIELELTNQKSNNPLQRLKNSSSYMGIRWANQ